VKSNSNELTGCVVSSEVESQAPMSNIESKVSTSEKFDQYYYGHGKLLLTGEYFVLDGATGLALPTKVGQSMGVRYSQSFNPKLTWKSYDVEGNLWLEATFEFWHFNIIDENPKKEVLLLQKLLREARKQNKHFLRDAQEVEVETRLGFPLTWGLGSSSTLIYNIAQWAYVSPFELLFNTQGGSGYDIACAQSEGPIVYEKQSVGPKWGPVNFYPSFHENLFFIFLGNKQDSREAVEFYSKKRPWPSDVIREVTALTREMLEVEDLASFQHLMSSHEQLLAAQLGIEAVGKRLFSDFSGEVKSLGAWGGDFVLAASDQSLNEVKSYFEDKGLKVVIPFADLILETPKMMPNAELDSTVH
jgi:mevalonate kinase